MVIRVWSRVFIAVSNPLPSSPIIRSAGMRTLSRYTSRVGLPLIPSFFSLAPNVTPWSDRSTTNAEMPRLRFSGSRSGSVTAITV